MDQTANAHDDDLPQLRAALTEATQALLVQVDSPRENFLHIYAVFFTASRALSQGLLGVAPHVSMELGEAYTLEGNALPHSAVFLLQSLSEFRRRKGID
jgi:hypothetical protein